MSLWQGPRIEPGDVRFTPVADTTSRPDALEATFGPLGLTNPLFILAVYAPGIAGIGLVLASGGVRALWPYLGRLTLWRMAWPWWVLLIVGIPAVFLAGGSIARGCSTGRPRSRRLFGHPLHRRGDGEESARGRTASGALFPVRDGADLSAPLDAVDFDIRWVICSDC